MSEYLIERAHPLFPGEWTVVGRFVAGSPWRDGRLVDDETMRQEVRGYRMNWPDYLARVRCPNGKILQVTQNVSGQWPINPNQRTQTLRQWYAGQAMKAMLGSEAYAGCDYPDLVRQSFDVADEMIRFESKKPFKDESDPT